MQQTNRVSPNVLWKQAQNNEIRTYYQVDEGFGQKTITYICVTRSPQIQWHMNQC